MVSLRAISDGRFTALAVAFAAAFGLLLCGLRTLDSGTPVPRNHDEFSYVLGAETFLAGRLTNPPHPLAKYFDTFHVIQRPTYASKYPPAQAAALAIGWKLGGRPLYGVWLGFVAMCVALGWMLLAWLSRPWALVASVSCIASLAITYWSASFWGGSVAATGGALVYGAMPRLQRKPSFGVAVVLGVGLAILANSRPFEGLLVSIPALVAVVLLLADSHVPMQRRLIHVGLPFAIVGAFSIGSMAVYNRAVTGHASLFPYVAYARENDPVPVFVWQQPPKQTYSNPRREAFRDWTLDYWRKQAGAAAGAHAAEGRLLAALKFLVPLSISLPLFIGLFFFSRASPWRYAAGAIVLVASGVVASTWGQPHYIAPIVAPFVAMYFMTLEHFWSRPLGNVILVRTVVVCVVAIWVLPPLAAIAAHLPGFRNDALVANWSTARAKLIDSLAASGTRHVLIVRYPSGYSMHNEWVYNGATIDSQPVVWAHDLGPSTVPAVQGYYPTRRILMLDPTDDPPYYRLTAANGIGADATGAGTSRP